MLDARAGSSLSERRPSGIITPAKAAASWLSTIAPPATRPSTALPFHHQPMRPTVTPTAAPLSRPRVISLSSTLRPSPGASSPRARSRMIMVSVCIPALPPWPATMGRKTTSAVHRAIVSSNRPTVAAARNAVARLMKSQGRRRRMETRHGVRARSSPERPTMSCMSSVASLRATSSASLALTTPTILPAASSTGSPR